MRLWSASPGACLEPGGSLGVASGYTQGILGVASGYTRGILGVASGWPRGAYRLATRWPEGGLGVASGWPYLEIANSRWANVPPFCILHAAFNLLLGVALPGFSSFKVRGLRCVRCWMMGVRCSGPVLRHCECGEMVHCWFLDGGLLMAQGKTCLGHRTGRSSRACCPIPGDANKVWRAPRALCLFAT
jgi:hypothetical protein